MDLLDNIDFSKLREEEVLDALSNEPKYCTVNHEQNFKVLTDDGLEMFCRFFKPNPVYVCSTHGDWMKFYE